MKSPRPVNSTVMCLRDHFRLTLFLVVGCIVLLAPFSCSAQDSNAKIDGVLVDPAGARVAAATVIITTQSTSRELRSDQGGEFHVTVPAATYRITIEGAGFKVTRLNGVRLRSGTSRSIKLVLILRSTKPWKCPKGNLCL
jgi:hypothetical protein